MIKRFLECLKEARARARLSQRALAERVGIADSYISRMETGAFPPPSRDVTVKLADALGMSSRPLTIYVSTRDKAALERFRFFLTAYVAGAEDVQEIRLVEVENDKVGQALTQDTPALQLPSTAGGEWPGLQQILTYLQQITAKLSRVEADVAELKDQKTVTTGNTLPKGSHDKSTSSPDTPLVDEDDWEMQAVKGVIEAVGGGDVEAALKQFSPNPSFEVFKNGREHPIDALPWYKASTKVELTQGNFYLMMNGFQSITVPREQYEWQVSPILNGEDKERAFIIREYMKQLVTCKADFESRMKTDKFFHIIPIEFLDWYLNTKFHSHDAWAHLLGGTEATDKQIAAHLRHIISLLESNTNYQIGLLKRSLSGEFDIYNRVHWKVKEGHAVLLENFILGKEQRILVTEPSVVAAFCRYFTQDLWNSEYVVKKKGEVINELTEYIRRVEERSMAHAGS
jgi:transcriptional regulator with XRE-family HTH domain